jgi:enamine deaminase RidA (YjgF/YER057c/UK114 family)
MLYTAHVPVRSDGSFETGPVAMQLRRTFANLRTATEAAGGSMADVMQVVVYLVDVNDFPTLNQVWIEVFGEPRPSRAVVGCSALAVDGVKVTITATACLP